MSTSTSGVSMDNLAALMAEAAGPIHDRLADTGPKIVFEGAADTNVYIGKLEEMNLVTSDDAAELRLMWDEIAGKKAIDQIEGSANRILGRDSASPLTLVIARIVAASVARVRKSPTDGLASIIGHDAAGAVLGGVAGAIAGGMIAGEKGALAGGIVGGIVIGGLASYEESQHHTT